MDIKIKIGDRYFKDFEMEDDNGIYTGNTQNAYGHEATGIILTDKIDATILSSRGVDSKIKQIIDLMRFGDIKKKNIIIEVEN
ncbi:hypothetical protein CBC_A1646 [Clostridium botulinum C str. Eklund]|nr:hypothetical protein CBC_A1646 [Clostridium botulinum C str. Eklund]